MRLSLTTWDGTSINNNASYVARFVEMGEAAQPRSEIKFVERPSNYPLLGYKRQNAREFEIAIEPLVDYRFLVDKLKQVFDTNSTGSTLKRLVAQDTDNNNKAWYLDCVVQESDYQHPELTVKLQAPDSYWTALTAVSTTNTNPTSASTWFVEAKGNASSFPIFRISPTGIRPTDGDGSRRWVTVINPNNTRLSNYPINLADGEGGNGLAASKLTGALTNLNDMRIIVNGTQVNRWLANTAAPATSRVHIWINLNLDPIMAFTTANSITASAGTDVGLAKNRSSDKVIVDLPERGQFLIENEMFTYRGKDVKRRVLKNVQRAAFNTNINNHVAGIGGSRIQHRILMTYGNSAFNTTVPNTDDANNFAPIFHLDSTNACWIYNQFYTRRGTNSAEWEFSERSNRAIDDSGVYTAASGATSPVSTQLGTRISGEQADARYRTNDADLWWTLNVPAGVNSVSALGQKYLRSSQWPDKAQLIYSDDGKKWTSQWNEAVPGTKKAWVPAPVTASNLHNLNASPQWIGFRFKGTQAGGSVQEDAYMEMSDVTVTMISASIPSVTLSGELAEYEIKTTLTNQTTGEAFKISVNSSTGETVVVDTEKRLVYIDSDKSNMIGGLELLGEMRSQWMSLAPSQNNTIRYDDVGTGNITILASTRDRNN